MLRVHVLFVVTYRTKNVIFIALRMKADHLKLFSAKSFRIDKEREKKDSNIVPKD